MPSYTCHDAQSSTRFVPAYNELLRCLKLRGALVDEPYKARNATVTRLIAIENATHREEYDYDYMGRRWRLKTFAKSGNDWTLTVEKRFVYDGYRQIAEFTMSGTTPALTATYLWQPGLDGCILRAVFGTAVRYFIPDGNRNIIQLRDASGAVTDSYAYGPFGQCAAAGATPNPFRFSCEYLDAATGLVYYNYRHYSPGFGRWLSRDFIDNISNILLYVFCKNKPIYLFDRLGLLSFAKRKNKREPKSVEIKVDKCTILVVYGHNYQNPAHDRHGYGVETVKNISAGSGANGCAHAAVLACFASLVPNSIPLPGYSPVNAKTYVTMFRGLMSTAEKEQFIDELLEMGFLVANDKEEAERILYAAQKTAAKMKSKNPPPEGAALACPP